LITLPVYSDRVQYRKAMIDEFDLDQDGEINEQEFFAIMMDDA
jgi:centrin-3